MDAGVLARRPTRAGPSAGMGATDGRFLGLGLCLVKHRACCWYLIAGTGMGCWVARAMEAPSWSSERAIHMQQRLGFNWFIPFLCG